MNHYLPLRKSGAFFLACRKAMKKKRKPSWKRFENSSAHLKERIWTVSWGITTRNIGTAMVTRWSTSGAPGFGGTKELLFPTSLRRYAARTLHELEKVSSALQPGTVSEGQSFGTNRLETMVVSAFLGTKVI